MTHHQVRNLSELKLMMNQDPIHVDLPFLLFLSMIHQSLMHQLLQLIIQASMIMTFLVQIRQVHMIFHALIGKIHTSLQYRIIMMFLQHLIREVLLFMMGELLAVQVVIHQAAHLFDLHQEVIPVLKHFHYPVLVDLIVLVWNNILVTYMIYLLNLNQFLTQEWHITRFVHQVPMCLTKVSWLKKHMIYLQITCQHSSMIFLLPNLLKLN